MKNKLLPCPFCGGDADFYQFANPKNFYYVRCSVCHCGTDGFRLCHMDSTPAEKNSANAADWNRRSAEGGNR